MHASKTVIWIVGSIIGLIVVLLAFRTGMVIGYRQAEYSAAWQHFRASHANTPFGRGGLLQAFTNPNDFINDHGAIGTIVSIATTTATGTSIIVHDIHDAVNKTIYVFSTTTVLGTRAMARNYPVSASMFQVGEGIAVIGTPGSQGQIVASIIHLVPASSLGLLQ